MERKTIRTFKLVRMSNLRVSATPDKQDSGNFIVTTELEDDSWLMTYLISYGSHLKVIEPLSLKNKVKQEIKQMLKNY